MTGSMYRSDDADRQRAFLTLLANPAITPWVDEAGYALVHRHEHTLGIWAKRLGYQIAHLDQCYRLRRVPIEGEVAVPIAAHPPRGVLLLSLYAAACLDEHREDSITLQELSDLVQLSAAGRGGWPYDPNKRVQRQAFVDALSWLIGQGVLEVRTAEQLRDIWAHTGTGIGAGYLIHREALVLCIDTGDVDLALRPQPSEGDTRGMRLLRRLVETQAVYPQSLTDDERDYLTGQRTRLFDQVQEMTGGLIEARADLIVLSLPADRALPDALLTGFPNATAVDWACLHIIDQITAATSGAERSIARDAVVDIARALHADAGSQLTKELSVSPQAIMAAVEERLSELGFLRAADDAWVLTPLAARYRAAQLATAADDEPASQAAFDLLEST